MWLTRFALTRPTVTIAIFAALIIFGVISFAQLGRSSSPPNTDFPIVAVFAAYPGASPQDMERMVIKPIEDEMAGVDNLDQLTATSQEGSAVVVVQFKMGTDLNLAAVDVQRRVDIARVYMPTDLDPPTVTKAGQSEPPLLDVAVSSTSLTQPQIADLINSQIEPADPTSSQRPIGERLRVGDPRVPRRARSSETRRHQCDPRGHLQRRRRSTISTFPAAS